MKTLLFLFLTLAPIFLCAGRRNLDSLEDKLGNIAHKDNLSADGQEGYDAGIERGKNIQEKYLIPSNKTEDYKNGFSLGFFHAKLAQSKNFDPKS